MIFIFYDLFPLPDSDSDSDRYYGKGIRIWIWVSGNMFFIIPCSHRVWNPSLNPSPAVEITDYSCTSGSHGFWLIWCQNRNKLLQSLIVRPSVFCFRHRRYQHHRLGADPRTFCRYSLHKAYYSCLVLNRWTSKDCQMNSRLLDIFSGRIRDDVRNQRNVNEQRKQRHLPVSWHERRSGWDGGGHGHPDCHG